jgi:hypothetical protein
MGYRRRRLDTTDLLPQLVGIVAILCFINPQVRDALRLSALAAVVVALGAGVFFVSFTLWRRQSVTSRDLGPVVQVSTGLPPKPTPPVPVPVSRRLNRIDWFQFEKLVGVMFERQGFRVQRRGGARPDGGIDLELHRGADRIAVQCKKWNAWKVGVRQLREFLGAMTAGGYKQGIFVAAADITGEARQFARTHNIKIMDRPELISTLEDCIRVGDEGVEAILTDPQKYCPRCERVMIVKVARRGRGAGKQFWGCPGFPRCSHTEPLPLSSSVGEH